MLLQPTQHKPCHSGGRFGHQGLGTNSPRLDGDTTVVSPRSPQQGCLEPVPVPRLGGVTVPKAAPNTAPTCAIPVPMLSPPPQAGGAPPAQTLHSHFDGYFFPRSPASA